MAIKKLYVDTETEEILAEDVISDEEIKALSIDMVSSNPRVVFFDWDCNAIHNKARQMIDEVCEEALNDQTDVILTKGEKGQIVSELAKSGRIITTVKGMPGSVKAMIVQKARVKTAAEKNAEFEAEQIPVAYPSGDSDQP